MLAALVSPDGKNILVGDPLGPYLMWPLDGGKPVPIETLRPRTGRSSGARNGRFLYIRGPDEDVLHIYRYNLDTGRRELWKKLAPRDPAGVIGVASGRGELAITQDGTASVFTYWTGIRNLFLAEGLPQ